MAGLITNLQSDRSMVGRAMDALQGELTRRQRLLHLAGNLPDLRAYTARRAADPRLDPLPSLLVVVDEFGELLAERPEFLDLFIAMGRVGRSLGVHLLLASRASTKDTCVASTATCGSGSACAPSAPPSPPRSSVSLTPTTSPRPPGPPALLLGYGNLSNTAIVEGVKRLASGRL